MSCGPDFGEPSGYYLSKQERGLLEPRYGEPFLGEVETGPPPPDFASLRPYDHEQGNASLRERGIAILDDIRQQKGTGRRPRT